MADDTMAESLATMMDSVSQILESATGYRTKAIAAGFLAYIG